MEDLDDGPTLAYLHGNDPFMTNRSLDRWYFRVTSTDDRTNWHPEMHLRSFSLQTLSLDETDLFDEKNELQKTTTRRNIRRSINGDLNQRCFARSLHKVAELIETFSLCRHDHLRWSHWSTVGTDKEWRVESELEKRRWPRHFRRSISIFSSDD